MKGKPRRRRRACCASWRSLHPIPSTPNRHDPIHAPSDHRASDPIRGIHPPIPSRRSSRTAAAAAAAHLAARRLSRRVRTRRAAAARRGRLGRRRVGPHAREQRGARVLLRRHLVLLGLRLRGGRGASAGRAGPRRGRRGEGARSARADEQGTRRRRADGGGGRWAAYLAARLRLLLGKLVHERLGRRAAQPEQRRLGGNAAARRADATTIFKRRARAAGERAHARGEGASG